MSTVKINNIQLGQSGTATQNFTLTAAQADGTLKLSRGNPGVTTQDILTVDSSGKAQFPSGEAGFPAGIQANNLPTFHCRAWVNFNGNTGAVRASGNVSGVVRNGVGDYTISFSTPMPDTNYTVSGTASGGSSAGAALNICVLGVHYVSGAVSLKTVSSVRVAVTDNNYDSLIDMTEVSVLIHR